jgi:hypothetical protein
MGVSASGAERSPYAILAHAHWHVLKYTEMLELDLMAESNTSSSPTLTFVVSISDDESQTGQKSIFNRVLNEPAIHEIPTDVLKQNLVKTLEGLRQLFTIDAPAEGVLPLKQVQVSFDVTASGKIALFGTGAELTGRGGIILTFGEIS